MHAVVPLPSPLPVGRAQPGYGEGLGEGPWTDSPSHINLEVHS